MKKIVGILLLIFGLLSISVSIFWYLTIGQKAVNVDTYNLGEVDKIKVRGNNTTFKFKTGTKLKINTNDLAIVQMNKEEMEQLNKDKEYYSAYLYFSKVDKVYTNTDWIPNSIKNINYFKNKNNKLAYFLDDVTYKNMHKALPEITAYKSMDSYQNSFKSKKTKFIQSYSDTEKTNILTYIYSMKSNYIFEMSISVLIVCIYFAVAITLLIESEEEKNLKKQKKLQKEASKKWKLPIESTEPTKEEKIEKIREQYSDK